MGLLNKTKCYQVGPMEYNENGNDWRKVVEARLAPRGVKLFNPYEKPFMEGLGFDLCETKEVQSRIIQLRQEEKYDEVAKIMRPVRSFDLAMVDKVDFIIARLSNLEYTCGTWEELFTANKSKKACYVAFMQGKKKCPLWLLGTIPHEYIFDSVEDILVEIEKIDDGFSPPDPRRWRLLKEEWR